MRQKSQLVLAFADDGRGEAPEAASEGSEPRAAGRRDETPAIDGQWMERVCELDNCKRALARAAVHLRRAGPLGLEMYLVRMMDGMWHSFTTRSRW